MKETEIKILDTHYKTTLERIQKLHSFFLAGRLPGKAILHLRQLSLFIMICNLPEDPLNIHALCMLKGDCHPKSWFAQINDICITNNLPLPLQLLKTPPPKDLDKKLFKQRVLDYWQQKLRK